jgi:hypothetical protein
MLRSLVYVLLLFLGTVTFAVALGMPLLAPGGRGILGIPGATLLLYTLAVWAIGRSSARARSGPPVQGPAVR